ncbi:uncharacterized protein RHO17_010458 [Thomomys bottae]
MLSFIPPKELNVLSFKQPPKPGLNCCFFIFNSLSHTLAPLGPPMPNASQLNGTPRPKFTVPKTQEEEKGLKGQNIPAIFPSSNIEASTVFGAVTFCLLMPPTRRGDFGPSLTSLGATCKGCCWTHTVTDRLPWLSYHSADAVHSKDWCGSCL